jgi:hypothetical protein
MRQLADAKLALAGVDSGVSRDRRAVEVLMHIATVWQRILL